MWMNKDKWELKELKVAKKRSPEDYQEFISKEWLLKNLMFETDIVLVEGAPTLHVYYPDPKD